MLLLVSLVATALIGSASAGTCQIAPNGTPCTCVHPGTEYEATCESLYFGELNGYSTNQNNDQGNIKKRFPPGPPLEDLLTHGFPNPHLGGSPSVVFNGRCIGGLKEGPDGTLLDSNDIENYYTCPDVDTERKRDLAITFETDDYSENGCCVLSATSTVNIQGPAGSQGLPGSAGSTGKPGVIVPSLHCSYSVAPGTATRLNIASDASGCTFGAQPTIAKRSQLELSAGEHVSVSVSVAYERTTSNLDSDSEGSRLTPASRCGPHLTLYVDDKIAFKSNKAIFASQGVVSGQVQLDLSIAAPHKFKLVVTSDHCSSNGLDIKIYNPVVSVALLGHSADQPFYYAGNSVF